MSESPITPTNGATPSTAPEDTLDVAKNASYDRTTELRDCASRFQELLSEKLSKSVYDKFVRAANFNVSDIKQILEQYPDAHFIRIYHGIDATGEHMMFMAPADHDKKIILPEQPTTSMETMSLRSARTNVNIASARSCCACPPRNDCPSDPYANF